MGGCLRADRKSQQVATRQRVACEPKETVPLRMPGRPKVRHSDGREPKRFVLPPEEETLPCVARPGINDPVIQGRTVMLTRRGFAGLASCAICGLEGFLAADASAQGAQSVTSGGVTRKLLSQIDGPVPGY